MALSVSEFLRTRGVIPNQKDEKPQGGAGPDTSTGDAELDEILTRRGSARLAPIVRAIFGQESNHGRADTSKVNSSRVRGPMQVKDTTFAQMQSEGRIPRDYRWDEGRHNKEAGVAYIEMLAERTNDPREIAQGYYGGPGAIGRTDRRDPKNPKAPTVGQYGDEVVARMGGAGPAPAASAPAQAAGSSVWDYVQRGRGAPVEEPQPQAEPEAAAQPQAPQGPVMTWDQVRQDPSYIEADGDTREQMREAYWAEVVAPQIPPQQLPAARAEFDRDTNPGFGEQALDVGKSLLGGAIKGGVGTTLHGMGEGFRQAAQYLADAAAVVTNPTTFQTDVEAVNPLEVPAEWVSEQGQAIDDDRTLASKLEQVLSTPEGDLTKPETWSFGADPSLMGYMQHGANVVGQLAPVIAAGALTGPVGAMAIGGAQGGGAAHQQARETIAAMSEDELMEQSPYYRQLRSRLGHEQAKNLTAEEAAKWAFRLTAPISALGGAATAKILSPAAQIGGRLVGSSVAGNAALRGGLSALEEGSQEVAEGMATEHGINVGAGTERDLMQGSLPNAVLGAIGGAGPGAIAGGGAALAAPDRAVAPASEPAPVIPQATPQPAVGPSTPTSPEAPPSGGATPAAGTPPPRARRARAQQSASGAEPLPAEEVLGPVVPETPAEQDDDDIVDPAPAPSPASAPAPIESQGAATIAAPPTEAEIDDEVVGETDFGQAAVDAAEAEPASFPQADAEAAREVLRKKLGAKQQPMAPEAATAPVPRERADIPPRLYRGFGRARKESAYNGAAVPVAGEGKYYAFDADAAKRYGPQIEERDVADLENPLVIRDGEQWKALTREAGWPYPNPHGLGPDRLAELTSSLRSVVQGKGHDGMIVWWDASKLEDDAYDPATGKTVNIKTLRNVFETPQAVIYDGAAPAVTPQPTDAPTTNDEAYTRLTALGYDVQSDDGANPYLARDGDPIEPESVPPNVRRAWEDYRASLASEDSEPVTRLSPIDAAAHEAATSPTNGLPEPTDAQKEAGNYKKGHLSVQGLDIAIENPKGSERSGTGKDGKRWAVTMPGHYGYFKGTVGKDKDQIDVTLGDAPDDAARPVFVFNQVDPKTGKFDEHKVFMGYADADQARAAYRASFSGKFGRKMENGLLGIAKYTPEQFKSWLASGDHKKPAQVAAEEPPVTKLLRERRENAQAKLSQMGSSEEFYASLPREPEKLAEWWAPNMRWGGNGEHNTGEALSDLAYAVEDLVMKSRGPQFVIEHRKDAPNYHEDPLGYFEHWMSRAVSGGKEGPPSTSAKAPRKPPAARSPDARQDSLLQYLARHPRGLSSTEATAQGIDQAHFNQPEAMVGIRRAFRKNGMTFDEAAESLAEAGFPVVDEAGNYTPNDLLDALSRELGGQKVYSNLNTKWMEDAARDRAAAEQDRISQELAEAAREADTRPAKPDISALMDAAKAVDEDAMMAVIERWEDDSPETLERVKSALTEIIHRVEQASHRSPAEAPDADEVGGGARPGVARRAPEAEGPAGEEAGAAFGLTASAAPPAAGPRSPQPPATDLFGPAPVTQQALADEQRRRDERRNGGQDSAETGNPNDLFSAARRNVDLEDVTGKPKVSANTIFTDDAADKARAIIKAKLGQLNAGIDPELLQAGLTLAGYHIEKGARTFAAFVQSMLEDMGPGVKPYLKQWYMAVRYDPRMTEPMRAAMTGAAEVDTADVDAVAAQAQTEPTGGDDAQRHNEGVERPGDERDERVRPEVLSNDGRGAARSDRRGSGSTRAPRVRPASGAVVSGTGPAGGGAEGDSDIPEAAPGTDGSDTGRDERGGRLPDRDPGAPADGDAGAGAALAAPQALDLDAKRAAQRAAERIPLEPGIDNVRRTLPFLMEGQQDDVHFAEQRFEKDDGYGVLFANGTGTGKTFTGLGIVKRFVRRGKSNILLIAPSEKIMEDWIVSARELDLTVNKLEDTRRAGRGITITSYANFGQNETLADREWDLVVADEAHYLSQNAEGDPTSAGSALRAITRHPRGAYRRAAMIHRDLHAKLQVAQAAWSEATKPYSGVPYAEQQRLEEAMKPLARRFEALTDEVKADVKAKQGKARTRVVLLSATPFAYDKSVDLAEGFLFDYGPEPTSGAYNTPDARGAFFIQHFGYRMRTGKLTEPDAEVDRSVMEVAFNGWLRRQGVMSTRMLDVPVDYERKFVLVNDAIGTKIDEGLEFLREGEERKYESLHDLLMQRWKYHDRMFLLESIKARAFVPIIRRELDAGRKVVVFHDFNKGGGFHPFQFPRDAKLTVKVRDGSGDRMDREVELGDLVRQFEAARPDLVNLDFSGLASPIATMEREFPEQVRFFNGTVPTKDRLKNVRDFNEEDGRARLLVVQADAGKEGISLHDRTGKFRRTEINLGMPVKPTAAIQIEGRIYRTGSASEALYLYGNTGTNFERYTFAQKIAERAGTAENLAMGEEARALKQSFIDAFEDAVPDHSPSAADGKGGKAKDRAARSALTPWDKAKSFYFGQQKKNSRTTAREGIDYFATPEPLALKMVEWAGVRAGESVLEPSAGHGAIARWFPESARRTIIEPSFELASRAALVSDAKLLNERFEDHHIVNKYDAIVMNPPFGTGGKTAMDHIEKAIGHLRQGGRLVALIPRGPSMDKRFNKWMYGDEDGKGAIEGVYTAADITLPTVAFERAGTSVAARIVVLDKVPTPELAANSKTLDFSGRETIKELFSSLEHATVPARPIVPETAAEPAPAAEPSAAAGVAVSTAAGTLVPAQAKHSKTGADLFIAKFAKRVEREEYDRLNRLAKSYGGWYSSFKGAGAIPGFQFKTMDARDLFMQKSGQSENGAAAYSLGDIETFATTVPQVREWLRGQPLLERLEIVRDIETLRRMVGDPNLLPDAEGLYYLGDTRAYLVANMIPTRADALRIYRHEVEGHLAVELYSDVQQAVGDILASRSPTIERLMDEVEELQPGLSAKMLAREVIALVAERGLAFPAVDRLIGRVRALIRKLGIKLEFTDADVRALVARAARAATKAQARRSTGVPMGEPVEAAYRRGGARKPSGLDHTGLIDAAFKHLGGKQFAQLVTSPLYDRVIRAGGRLLPEKLKQGLVSDYGLDEPYLDRKIDKQAAVNQVLRKTRNLIDMLAGLDREQSRIAYLWMNEKPDTDLEATLLARLPEDSRAVMQRMKDLVDELGRDAVDVGLLSQESYERNAMAYMHRTYKVHMATKGESVQARHKKNASIRADNYKGRGLRDDVDPTSLGEYELGDMRLRIEKRGPRGGLQEVRYIPTDEAIPEGWVADGEWEIRWEDQRPGVGAVVGMWRDLTPEERQRLGEVEEVRFAFAKTMLNAIHDIENQKFLAWVADTYAVEDTDGLDLVEASDGFLSLKTYRKDQYVKVPTTGIPKTPGLKKYGALAGKVIPAVMWNDIRNTMALPESDLMRFYDRIMRAWKISKTALSPTVHVNNVMSNFVLADIAEVRARDVATALKTLIAAKQGDGEAEALIARYEDSGAEQGSFHAMEIQQDIIKPLLRELEQSENEGLLGDLSAAQIVSLLRAGDFKNAAKAAGQKAGIKQTLWAGGRLIDLYRNEDSVFRFAKFVRELEAGRSDRDAGKAARDAFLNYEINAPVIQAARRTALPFIAFSYRAIPKMLETAAHKPWKLAKYFTAGYALNALFYSMLGLGDDDEKRERALLPEELQGRVLGVFPRLVRLPWNDANDAPTFLDVRRWVPAGDMMDTYGSHSAVPLPNWLSVGGPLAFAMEAYANRSAFTGEPIIKDSDSAAQKAQKFADYAFKWAAPNLPLPNPLNFVLPAGRDGDEPRVIDLGLLPGVDRDQMQTYAWTGVMRAGTGREDAFGRESGSVGQALASSIGIKVRSYPTDVAKKRVIGETNHLNAEIDKNIRALAKERARGGLTQEEYRERLDTEIQKKRNLYQEAAAKLGAGAAD